MIETIDDVLAELARILRTAEAQGSPRGYFPALYRRVTAEVKEGIANGRFENGPRMEFLDVVFARRYLEAEAAWVGGGAPTTSWKVAFQATERWAPIVLQHLLGGINAHINLDLGIAAAKTAQHEAGRNGTSVEAEMASLKADFDSINAVLSSLVGTVKAELSAIWPPLRILDRLAGDLEDKIIDFSLEVARDGAWTFALDLSRIPPQGVAAAIAKQDGRVAELADELVYRPGPLLRTLLFAIRVGEFGTVPHKIRILDGRA